MSAVAESIEARFKPGERVRVIKAAPLGHVRTPWYIRGHTGIVERVCGAFPNPEELAYARSGEPRHWLQAIDFLSSRKKTFPFEEMISANYTLEQVNEALQAMASYQVVKPVILFQ